MWDKYVNMLVEYGVANIDRHGVHMTIDELASFVDKVEAAIRKECAAICIAERNFKDAPGIGGGWRMRRRCVRNTTDLGTPTERERRSAPLQSAHLSRTKHEDHPISARAYLPPLQSAVRPQYLRR
jgi:hypothetical protein